MCCLHRGCPSCVVVVDSFSMRRLWSKPAIASITFATKQLCLLNAHFLMSLSFKCCKLLIRCASASGNCCNSLTASIITSGKCEITSYLTQHRTFANTTNSAVNRNYHWPFVANQDRCCNIAVSSAGKSLPHVIFLSRKNKETCF